MELAESAESALVSYLKSLLNPDQSPVWPSTLQRDPPSNALRIFAGEDDSDKDGQCISCIAKTLSEHIPSSANYEVLCDVWLRTPVRALTGSEKQDGTILDPLTSHKLAAEQLRKGLMTNGLELSLTAAQPNFTVFGILKREGLREDTAEYWASGLSLTLVCCGASFPN